MKFIPYKKFKDAQNDVDTVGILIIYLNDARHGGGANFEEMGQRIDLVKRLRAFDPKGAQKGFVLDAAEYTLIGGIFTYRFPWGANEHVYEILTDIKNAKAPELKKVRGRAG